MTEGSFKFILIIIPVFLWCTPLQDRIYNYSSIPEIQYQESLIQTGLLFNANKNFTSYAFYSQFWASANLAIVGSIAPYNFSYSPTQMKQAWSELALLWLGSQACFLPIFLTVFDDIGSRGSNIFSRRVLYMSF